MSCCDVIPSPNRVLSCTQPQTGGRPRGKHTGLPRGTRGCDAHAEHFWRRDSRDAVHIQVREKNKHWLKGKCFTYTHTDAAAASLARFLHCVCHRSWDTCAVRDAFCLTLDILMNNWLSYSSSCTNPRILNQQITKQWSRAAEEGGGGAGFKRLAPAEMGWVWQVAADYLSFPSPAWMSFFSLTD